MAGVGKIYRHQDSLESARRVIWKFNSHSLFSDGQHRAGRVADNPFGCAPKEKVLQPGPTMSR